MIFPNPCVTRKNTFDDYVRGTRYVMNKSLLRPANYRAASAFLSLQSAPSLARRRKPPRLPASDGNKEN